MEQEQKAVPVNLYFIALCATQSSISGPSVTFIGKYKDKDAAEVAIATTWFGAKPMGLNYEWMIVPVQK